MRRIPILPDKSPSVPDLLWISKHQQQHPSTYAHPLKNTVRIDSNGIRHKFDGKQWRPLCHSPDGFECRNVAFRSSLCQKHFYKINLFKRPYTKHGSHRAAAAAAVGKRSVPDDFEHQPRRPSHDQNAQLEEIYDDDDDSIELLENNHVSVTCHSLSKLTLLSDYSCPRDFLAMVRREYAQPFFRIYSCRVFKRTRQSLMILSILGNAQQTSSQSISARVQLLVYRLRYTASSRSIC